MQTYQDAQLDALGDSTRRAILARLRKDGPLAVGKLAHGLPVSRPAISQHLKVLREAHLVLDQPVGNRNVYRLNPEGFNSLRDYFDNFWTQALDSFKTAVEKDKSK